MQVYQNATRSYGVQVENLSSIPIYTVLVLHSTFALLQYDPFGHSNSAMLDLCISMLQAGWVVNNFLKLDGRYKIQPISFSWVVRHIVPSFLVERAWIKEVLVQMVYIFEDVSFHSSRHGNIIDQALVWHQYLR
jgi:hypothetical protein